MLKTVTEQVDPTALLKASAALDQAANTAAGATLAWRTLRASSAHSPPVVARCPRPAAAQRRAFWCSADTNVWEEKRNSADGPVFYFNPTLSRICASADELPPGAKIVKRA